jgi:anti-anti-sigma regulatory factor
MFKLPSELAINQVEDLHREVLHELEIEQDVCIDISDVVRADTASVQLLCALQKYLLRINHKIIWSGESKDFNAAVDELGLTEFLAVNKAR